MRAFCLLAALALTSPASPALAANKRTPLARYELAAPAPESLRAIAPYLEITNHHGNTYEVLVPAGKEGLLALLAPTARLLEEDIGAALRRTLEGYREAPLASYGYREFAEVGAWLEGAARAYPELARVEEYGRSGEGRPLRALRINKEDGRSGKPRLLLTAATHGDELITTEVLTRLTDLLLRRYGEDPRLTRIVEEHELYIVPVVNADGFAERDRYDFGQDPNRNYPYPNDIARVPTPSIRPLVAFVHAKRFRGSLDFHASGEMVMYPWAYTYDPIAAEAHAKLNEITARMAAANQYRQGPISRVIYLAPGSSCDYYFWKVGTLAVTVEIGRAKAPPPAEFAEYLDSQTESTWRFLESF